MGKVSLYEVWFTRGDGLRLGPKFRSKHDATAYIEQHAGEARFVLRTPDGRWETRFLSVLRGERARTG